MAAGTYNFTVEQGTTMNIPLAWKDASNIAINITGYTARMQAREGVGTTTILHEWTTENAGIVIDGPTGGITLKATATITAGWNWPIPSGSTSPKAKYDLELISATGVVTRLLKGEITLDLEVTR